MTAQQVYQASTERSAWYQTVLAMFEEFDYLAVPTEVFPFDAELDWPSGSRTATWTPLDGGGDALDAVRLPGDQRAGRLRPGQPAGGIAADRPPQGDLDVLRLAHAYGQARDWARPPTALWAG